MGGLGRDWSEHRLVFTRYTAAILHAPKSQCPNLSTSRFRQTSTTSSMVTFSLNAHLTALQLVEKLHDSSGTRALAELHAPQNFSCKSNGKGSSEQHAVSESDAPGSPDLAC